MAKLINSELMRSVLIRSARTFIQSFLAVLVAAPVLELSAPTLKAAGVAGVASVLSMFHRLLDDTPVPSLVDRGATPGPAGQASAGQAAMAR